MKKKKFLDQINTFSENTLVKQIGIEFTDFGEDFVCAKMPVDSRTVQPYGLLHDGASAALAETLGSVAGGMHIDKKSQRVVGIEINCNHLKSVEDGYVYGKATPLQIGRKIQVWNIEIKNDNESVVAVSRLTLAVIDK